jgi:hypothetical protein
MARLRYDNAVGTLGGSLTAGATSITFASAPSFATLTGSDYIPLVLDPASGIAPNTNYEVVHLTAFTAGATTGTIARGQDGSSAQTHANGATWMCAPVSLDVVGGENVNTVGTSGSSQTISDPWTSPPFYTITDLKLTAACTLTFPTAAAGKSFTIILRQDATGLRTVTWPTVTWLTGGTPSLSTAANAVDVATFVCTDGTNWIGMFSPGYADASPPPSGLQAGCVAATDLAMSSISLNSGTGALTFTLASASPVWVLSSGVLVPVTYTGTSYTLTPSLPASTKYAVIGVEIDTTGTITLVKGSDTATQLNTGSLIASNTPGTSSGKMRVADFAYWNNAGTINFGDHTTTPSQGVNWIDRRPWTRGARYRYDRGTGGDYTTTSGSLVAIDSTNLVARVECAGVPLRVGVVNATFANNIGSFNAEVALYVDGAQLTSNTDVQFLCPGGDVCPAAMIEFTPAAGSHLVTLYWATAGGTLKLFGGTGGGPTFSFLVEEVVRQSASNGSA